jgi:predicted DNA-binding transcriptional regulator YafY
MLEKIRTAARQQSQVRIRYQGSTSDQSAERLVDPYALAHRSGWWYLVGYCHLRQGLRTFRVDRIQELELLSQKFQAMENFDVRAYLEAWFNDQPVVRARLRFEPEAAFLATSNLAAWERQEHNADGSVEVTAAAPDLNWLAAMVLGFAGWVRVLEPPELIEMAVRGRWKL